MFKDNFYMPSKMLLKKKERINLYSHCCGVHDAIDVLFCHTSLSILSKFLKKKHDEETAKPQNAKTAPDQSLKVQFIFTC